MDQEPHAYFFHYTTRQAAFGDILPEKKLRFSRYMDMRDPLENKSWQFVGGAWGENEEQQVADYFAFHRMANYIRERSFLLSLTIDVPPDVKTDEEEPFSRGWARARMWEPYAENHEGVCLVFDRDRLISTVVNSLRKQGFAPPYHRRIIYVGAGMEKPSLDLNDLAGDVTPSTVAKFIEENHGALFFHKALDWETEHEYRFSTTSTDKKDLYVEYGDALVAVIAGENLPAWQRPAAIEACRQASVESLRLNWSIGLPVLGSLSLNKNRRDVIRESLTNARGAAPPKALTPDASER